VNVVNERENVSALQSSAIDRAFSKVIRVTGNYTARTMAIKEVACLRLVPVSFVRTINGLPEKRDFSEDLE
jgi:hypothetical protein